VNQKFFVSVMIVFLIAFALSYAVHGIWLFGEYSKLPNLMRPQSEAPQYFPYFLLAQVLFAFGFTWIYCKGREDKPWLAQGLRFGLAVAVLSTIPGFLIYHAVSPYPLHLTLKQIAGDTVSVLLLGMVVAWLNRGRMPAF
jgi:hypothetical protein